MSKHFQVEFDANAKRVLKSMPSFGKRIKATVGAVSLLAAEYTLERTLARIPKDPEWENYRKSIAVGEVNRKGAAYAVFIDAKSRKIESIPVNRSVFFVKRITRGKLEKVSPKIKVLEAYSPWTADMMPFMPTAKEAVVTTRTVTPTEVKRVAKLRTRDRHKWRRELEKAGVRVPRKSAERKPLPKEATVLPDVAYDAYRLEFGLGGTASKAHWRPALMELRTHGLPAIFQSAPIQRAFSDPKFNEWQKWPPKVTRKVPASFAPGLFAFQKKVMT